MDPQVTAAIQPWIDAYDAFTTKSDQTGKASPVTFQALTVTPVVAREILRLLTGQADA
jgi:hypothetical protein